MLENNLIERLIGVVERIARALEASNPEPPAPNYKADIKEYPDYQWDAIGAEIEQVDRYGAATVLWRGKRFVRRSPENSYGAVVFFSRCVGKDESGKDKYERLITFEKSDHKVRSISPEVEGLLDDRFPQRLFDECDR